jgi:phosphoserine aminotransferase
LGSQKIKEANFEKPLSFASSAAENYNHIPKGYAIPTDADYFLHEQQYHFGTQMKEFLCNNILLYDMSSDIFSRVLIFQNLI